MNAIKSLHDQPRVVQFVLPLLGFNKYTFGDKNFYGAKISRDLRQLQVTVYSDRFCHQLAFTNGYLTTILSENTEILVYNIPTEYDEDLKLWSEGRYSEISDYGKERIRLWSNRPYKKPKYDNHGFAVGSYSDIVLLVLDRSPILRSMIEDELDMVLTSEQELMEAPDNEDFY